MGKHDKPQSIEDLIDDSRPCLAICAGKKCAKAGTKKLIVAAEEALSAAGLEGRFALCLTKCQDYCDEAPVVAALPGPHPYIDLTPAGVRQIVSQHLAAGQPVRGLLHKRARRRLDKQERGAANK